MRNSSGHLLRVWGLCSVLSAAAVARPPTQLRFEITPIRSLLEGGAFASPEAINNRGDVVGTSPSPSGAYRPFLYRNGTTTELLIGDPGQSGYAVDINDSGDIVARAVVKGREHTFLIQRQGIIDLHIQTGLEISPLNINDRGVIAANVWQGTRNDAVTWSKGVVRYLESDSTRGSDAGQINNHGQVLASLYGAPFPSEPAGYYSALFSGRSILWLRFAAGLLNDRGHIAGQYYSTNELRAVLFRDGVWRDVGMLPGDVKIRPAAINNSDWIVGTSEGPGEVERAFLYADGQLHDLNDLIPPNSGWRLLHATNLNDRGEITAYGSNQGQESGLLLRPTKRGRK